MTNTNELPARYGHVAVHMENCILVFGGQELFHNPAHSLRTMFMYNICTEQWGKHVIPEAKLAPPKTVFPCAVMIEGDIYMFGGWQCSGCWKTNALWKLTRTPTKCFKWSKIMFQERSKTPSPRYGHTGWEYAGQLWTFGGVGDAIDVEYHLQ